MLDLHDPRALTGWLRARDWIDADEEVGSLTPAGEGNMNLTLRAHVGPRTLIVKQSRPWVEKHPSIAAPVERALVEAAFYSAVADRPALACGMPRLLFVDRADRVLALEDLGSASDCTDLYAGATLPAATRDDLLRWLSDLHAEPLHEPDPLLRNRAMRALNHEHIFDLPLRPGALDADAFCHGLEPYAAALRADTTYVDWTRRLGDRYLADGDRLLHGDFYPGSWLRTAAGVRVIDPEFCFLGPAEFDVGVMLAHALLAGGRVDAERAAIAAAYAPPDGFSWSLAQGFAGVEIMRRLIGVAQLPLSADLARRTELLRHSRALVLFASDQP